MRAIVITKQSKVGEVAAAVRAVEDWPEPPAPAPGEALIRTEFSALNRMDLWVGVGVPGLDLTWPRVGGCDACGVVEEVGAGVDPGWVGKRVVFNAAVDVTRGPRPGDPPASSLAPEYELIGEHRNGAHCERFVAPVANLQDVGGPDGAAAAAFGLTALTAWGMFRKAGVRPGQSVLITGIGGGVATNALAIAKWLGCPTAVTSRHQWKLDKAKTLGADHGVLDSGQDWSKDVRAWTRKRGVDVVIDSIGKPAHMASIASLARGGAFVTCGATAGPIAETHLGRLFWGQLRLLGSTMGSNAEFAEVVSLFRAGHVKPAVDHVFGWREGARAWEKLEGGEQFGKIVIKW